ncbi:MAG: Lrp/AsnC family transcriptional regulator [Anaerolineales bacterium]|nr:Lrp/AsnC family transcriptional regulator [Anaerolineales bacterium]
MLDDIDHQICDLLQSDARMSNAAIAEQVGLTSSTVFERVKKLEKKGVIQRYVAIVDGTAVGKSLTAFVRIVIGTGPDDDYMSCKRQFSQSCLQEPDVLECHTVAGEDCYVLKVRTASPLALESLLERIRSYAPVVRSTSSIVLSTVKEETKISIV